MKKLRAWFTVGSFAFLGSLAAVSCGSDEATGDGAAGGNTIGGSGGMDSGVPRDTGGGSAVGELGNACATDAECGEGLICIKRDDVDTLGGAPPRGLCTVACTSHDACLEHSSDAWCVEYEGGGYCLEGCAVDSLATPKCHDRPEFVCHALDFAPSGDACEDSSDCDTGSVCLSGECNVALTVCLPQCGSDADCTGGLFCDYITGLCVEDAPTGKDFNDACDPSADADPNECVGGLCMEGYEDPSEGTCGGFCNLGHPFACGYTGEGKADAACLFGSVLAGDQTEIGDLGLCGQLCDCNDECSSTGEVCRPFNEPTLEELWQRLGYCVPIIPDSGFTEDDSLGACAGGAPGTGGAGGAGAGGAPADAGAGGVPASGGGAGGSGGA